MLIMDNYGIVFLNFCGNPENNCSIKLRIFYYQSVWEDSGSVVECLTRNQRVAGLSLICCTALCP